VNQQNPVSDEMINAFIDNELEAEEHDFIVELAGSDQQLSGAIEDARNLKGLVQAAKPSVTTKSIPLRLKPAGTYGFLTMIASIVFISVIAFSMHQFNLTPSMMEISGTDSHRGEQHQKGNLVLDLRTADKKSVSRLFVILTSLLDKSDNQPVTRKIEVIFTGPGMVLLQTDKSDYIYAIQVMKKKYNNISFIACGKTFNKLQRKQRNKIEIIKSAMLVASGPQWIEKRKQQGWSYLYI